MVNPSGLIGFTGFIGSELMKSVKFNFTFDRKNINDISQVKIDTICCSAPTGNRRWANSNAKEDLQNIQSLMKSIKSSSASKVILISTIDALAYTDTPYGNHRAQLEKFIKNNYNSYTIIRLCTIIHPTIQKNILYDLANSQFIENINGQSSMQWCKLDDIIDIVKDAPQGEVNLFSPPILNNDIISKFFTNMLPTIQQNTQDAVVYDVSPYWYTRDQIFNYIGDYIGNR